MKPSREMILAERSSNSELAALSAGVNHVAFARQGDLMAVSRTDMTVDLYVAGAYSRTFNLGSRDPKVRPTQRIRGLAFGRLGDRLIVAGADKLRCISLAPAAPSWKIVPPRSFGFLVSSPLAISVSEQDYIAATFDNGTIGVWTPLGSNLFLRRESNSPRCLDFADGDDLIIGTDGFSLCSWDTARGRPRLRKLLGERAYASICWKKGAFVGVRFLGSVGVLDARTGALIWARGLGVGLPILAFEEETGRLAVPEEHAVTVFDVEGHELFRRSTSGGMITSVAFHPKTGEIAIGKMDGEIEMIPGSEGPRFEGPSDHGPRDDGTVPYPRGS